MVGVGGRSWRVFSRHNSQSSPLVPRSQSWTRSEWTSTASPHTSSSDQHGHGVVRTGDNKACFGDLRTDNFGSPTGRDVCQEYQFSPRESQ